MVFCDNAPKRIASRECLTEDDDNDDNSLLQLQETRQRRCRKTAIRSAVALLLSLLLFSIILWVVVPVVFMLSPSFQTFMVFVPIDSPRNADFDRPQDFGLRGVRNFHLRITDYDDNSTTTTIGAWLLLPEDQVPDTRSATMDVEEILRHSDRDVLIYLHGVFANRAKALEQYRVLRQHFLVVAVDHRGYGDSGPDVRMSETAIANDHVQVYDWIRKLNRRSTVYFWGHSLGSALGARAVRMIYERDDEGPKPDGLVLESPFTALQDVLVNIAIGKMFKWLAYFPETVLDPLDRNGFRFRSGDNVRAIDCPVMILHAEDDFVVPYFLGERLAAIAEGSRKNHQGSVVFHGISAEFGFGHNRIVLHPRIGEFIDGFKTVCRNFTAVS